MLGLRFNKIRNSREKNVLWCYILKMHNDQTDGVCPQKTTVLYNFSAKTKPDSVQQNIIFLCLVMTCIQQASKATH